MISDILGVGCVEAKFVDSGKLCKLGSRVAGGLVLLLLEKLEGCCQIVLLEEYLNTPMNLHLNLYTQRLF